MVEPLAPVQGNAKSAISLANRSLLQDYVEVKGPGVPTWSCPIANPRSPLHAGIRFEVRQIGRVKFRAEAVRRVGSLGKKHPAEFVTDYVAFDRDLKKSLMSLLNRSGISSSKGRIESYCRRLFTSEITSRSTLAGPWSTAGLNTRGRSGETTGLKSHPTAQARSIHRSQVPQIFKQLCPRNLRNITMKGAEYTTSQRAQSGN